MHRDSMFPRRHRDCRCKIFGVINSTPGNEVSSIFIARCVPAGNLSLIAQGQQILSVSALGHGFGKLFKLIGRDVSEVIRDFFRAGNHQSLAALDGLDIEACLEERIVRAGIEPSHAAAHHLDFQLARFEIETVEIGDLQFASRRRLEIGCQLARHRCRRSRGR